MSHNIPMTFNIYQGDQLVRTERLTQDIIKIGKLPSSHLRIDDDNVSRMHAVIEITGPDEIFIIDLGSTSGTIVNGKKVNKAKLSSGDEVMLGATRVVVEIAGASALDEEPTRVAATVTASASAPPPPASSGTIPGSIPAPPPPAPPPNPFAQPIAASTYTAPVSVHPAEDPDKVRYGIVASGPAVSSDEVETGQQAIEVMIMWGENSVLHVAHLSPPRAFYVGEATDAKGKPLVDYLVGSEVLGTDRMPVVVESGGGVAVVIPPGATCELTVNGQSSPVIGNPSGAMPGAQELPLPGGAMARVRHKNLIFVVRPVNAGKPVGVGGGPKIEYGRYKWTAVSLGVHAVFLLLMYFLPPSPSSLSLDLLSADNRFVKYLLQPPEVVEEEVPDFLQQNNDDQEGGTGKRHKDEEGAMGKTESKKTKNRYGIQGPQDNQDPHMAREQAREQAKVAGILGVLRASTGAWNSPTSPYGRDEALGADPMSALGALMGDQIGENFGFGGLGLRGTGRGGGGTGEGTIGLGNLGTIGHGGGGGTGSGYGRGAGGFSGREARVPRIRPGTADVRGSLSKEVIRRVIQRHINEVRFCYEQELNQRPDLEGRVAVSFIISPTGAVQSSNLATSTMNNSGVDNCIVGAVRRWTFPSPEGGGIVVVTYPFVLQAAGG